MIFMPGRREKDLLFDTGYRAAIDDMQDNLIRNSRTETIDGRTRLSDEVRDILFSEENECQKVCDRLNAGLGNFLYKNNGESVKEYIKIEKEDKRGKKVR